MRDDSTKQPLWKRLEKLPGYEQSALASVFIPFVTFLFGCLTVAFPGMILIVVPLAMVGLGLSIFSIVSGYRRRMTGIFVSGLFGFVLNGMIAFCCLSVGAFLFGGFSGC